jgi:hypothetical protein
MSLAEWSLTAANAAGAALLLNSGIAKAVTPDPLRRALSELVPALETERTPSLIRGLAAVEAVAAVALLVGPARIAAAVLTALLGLVFTAFGLLGKVRGGSAPCGCFGASGRQPLGWTNVVLGLLLAAVYPINVVGGVGTSSRADYTSGAVLLAAIGSLLLCVYTHRRLVNSHFMARLREPRPAR